MSWIVSFIYLSVSARAVVLPIGCVFCNFTLGSLDLVIVSFFSPVRLRCYVMASDSLSFRDIVVFSYYSLRSFAWLFWSMAFKVWISLSYEAIFFWSAGCTFSLSFSGVLTLCCSLAWFEIRVQAWSTMALYCLINSMNTLSLWLSVY